VSLLSFLKKGAFLGGSASSSVPALPLALDERRDERADETKPQEDLTTALMEGAIATERKVRRGRARARRSDEDGKQGRTLRDLSFSMRQWIKKRKKEVEMEERVGYLTRQAKPGREWGFRKSRLGGVVVAAGVGAIGGSDGEEGGGGGGSLNFIQEGGRFAVWRGNVGGDDDGRVAIECTAGHAAIVQGIKSGAESTARAIANNGGRRVVAEN
jgi:hypothetical protein